METSETPNTSVEALLTERLNNYSINDVQDALGRGNFDATAAIKVAPIKEEEVEGELIQDSAAEVAPNTPVNAHLHTGGEDQATKELKGLEVYKILAGEGLVFLGYPEKREDGTYVKDENGVIEVNYDPPTVVRQGSFVSVKPGQVHSLRNTSMTDKLTFVFTGSPAHLGTDRIMVQNPPAPKPLS